MKRINVRLLVILLTCTLGSCVAVFGINRFQVSRSAQTLLDRADRFYAEGNHEEARKTLSRYLHHRPDDHEELARLAMWSRELFLEHVETVGWDPKKFGRTYGLMEQAIRKNPDNTKLRASGADLALKFRRLPDAISHFEFLIEQAEQNNVEPDADWFLRLAQCFAFDGQDDREVALLCTLTGYDVKTEQFDTEKAKRVEEADAYLILAAIFRDRQRSPEKADKMIDQMVAANADSYESYLRRAQYLTGINGEESDEKLRRADQDIIKSLDMVPEEDSPQVVLAAAEIALKLDDFDRAKKLYDRYREANPDNVEIYRLLSNWALKQGDMDGARDFIDQGLSRMDDHRGLLWARANLELQDNDLTNLAKTIVQLRELNYPRAMLGFLEGRRDAAQQNWLDSSKKLELARPQLVQSQPDWIPGLDRMLALCYERLGQHDKRLRTYERVLESVPGDYMSRWGEVQALLALGQKSRALEKYQLLDDEQIVDDQTTPLNLLVPHLQLEILLQMSRDEDARNWQRSDLLAQRIFKSDKIIGQAKFAVLASYFRQKGEHDKANKIDQLARKADPGNLVFRLGSIRKRAREDVDAAMKELDMLESEIGDVVPVRQMRVELLVRKRPEDLLAQLAKLGENMDAFSDAQRTQIYKTLGATYFSLAEYEEVRKYWRLAAKNAPQDLDIRIRLFELALLTGEETDMTAAVGGIKAILGPDSPEGKWAQAAQITWRVKNQLDEPSALLDARGLLDAAKVGRTSWDALYRLEAEIAFIQNDVGTAMRALEESLRVGNPRPQVVRTLVRLKYEAGDLASAKSLLEQLDQSLWTPAERRISIQLKARTEGLPANLADLGIDEDASSPADLLWVGKLLASDKRFEEAADRFRRAVDLAPANADAWLSLVRALAAQGKQSEAESTLQQARLEVPEQMASVFMAQGYQALGNSGEAFRHYQMASDADPKNLRIMQAMANLIIARQQPERAAGLLDKILKIGAENPQTSSSSIAWARRQKAKLLTASNTYHDFVEALQLIEANASDGQILSPVDLLMLSRMCSARNDGVSRDRAIKHLERTKLARRLGEEELLVLAELYKKQDRWQECSAIMGDLLAANPNDMKLLTPWLRWLLEKDELQLTEKWLDNCNPDSLTALRTRAHLLVRQGRSKDARAALLQLVPPLEEINKENLQLLRALSIMFEEIGEHDEELYVTAEKLLRGYVLRAPDQKLVLAAYLGRRGGEKNLNEAFQLCQQEFDEDKAQNVIPVGVGLLRMNRKDLPNDTPYFKIVRGWFDSVLRQSPDMTSLLIQRSEFEDLVGDFDAVEEWIRKYLDNSNVTPHQKALASNNLAYVLALRGNGVDAMELIEFAIKILGPVADLRDTRAMVYLAQKQPMKALTDLDAAISEGETPFKFFHKALAETMIGNRSGAVIAMDRAKELGFDATQLNSLEQEQHSELVTELGLDSKSAGRTVSTAAF